ncbi:MAG: Asp23/Gls24 family envelope stress response protein [Clostridiales bacterium]|nr:Asp23/Gls24 family envelope stress response protein [Clostridiales bacterium]MDD7034909.1 hypothetical protein [Bacillota bacterium]MDY2920330.1 hypothetical protein [Lentihominibacter sp.]
MKVYSLSGKSGTGKSFQAINLCKQYGIESIIDDGLFICRNKVMAGVSAKRQKTSIRAVKTALFTDDSHMEEVRRAIDEVNPYSVLVLGTSDEMVDRIIARLELPEPFKRIYIEDITTEEEREIARHQRKDMGQHVIPAPTFQLKRQFSGYFMSPLRMLKDLGKDFGPWRDASEKSVVRPTYSYLGEYKISDKVISDIVECAGEEGGAVYEVQKVITTREKATAAEGIEIYVVLVMKYGEGLVESALELQKRIAEQVETMTAFVVNRVDLEIRGAE